MSIKTMSADLENDKENNSKKNNNQETGAELKVECPIKHLLHKPWTLWYYENDKNLPWEMNQKEVASFETVEDFWNLYSHLKRASDLKQGTDYAFFRKGIKPMWEDEANMTGGRWLIGLDRKQRCLELDRYWLDIILWLIGESFEYSNTICGAVVNIRYKGDKIGVWTSDASNSCAVLEVGRKLKDRLHIPARNIIGYETHNCHKDPIKKAGSVSKFSYIV